MLCGATSLILIWSFIYGFASYQNLGSASRFKLQILPILVTLLVYFAFQKKTKSEELDMDEEIFADELLEEASEDLIEN